MGILAKPKGSFFQKGENLPGAVGLRTGYGLGTVRKNFSYMILRAWNRVSPMVKRISRSLKFVRIVRILSEKRYV